MSSAFITGVCLETPASIRTLRTLLSTNTVKFVLLPVQEYEMTHTLIQYAVRNSVN